MTEGTVDERDAAGAAITEWLDGARRPVDQLVAALRDDWSPSLLRGVLGAPAFVTDHGATRRRTADEPWDLDTDTTTTRGVLTGSGWRHVVLARPPEPTVGAVTISHRAAAVLDVTPGVTRGFDLVDGGALTLAWASPYHRQPTLDGLPTRSDVPGAGDLLLVRLDRRAPIGAVRVLAADAEPDALELAELLGLDPATMAVDLAEALDVHGDRAAGALRRRGDRRLGDVVAGATWH